MILRAENLIKRYKTRTVVKGVSVEVKQGEIVGLLGPNGAGKTTSFYMIVGLIQPNGGRIFLDEREITNEPVYKRAQLGVGYLAQEASVFRKLSVEDNIKAILEMSDFSKEYQKERLEEMLNEFSLQKIRKSLGKLKVTTTVDLVSFAMFIFSLFFATKVTCEFKTNCKYFPALYFIILAVTRQGY